MLQKAAELGFAKSQFNVGVEYFNGDCGVEQDLPKALKWARLAAAQGLEPAKAALSRVGAALKESMNRPPTPVQPASALKYLRCRLRANKKVLDEHGHAAVACDANGKPRHAGGVHGQWQDHVVAVLRGGHRGR